MSYRQQSFFRNTISSRQKRRRLSLLPGNNNKRTISGIHRAADTIPTQNVSKPGHLMQNQQYTAPIVEQRTHASFAYKNTPRNSIAQTAATTKFTQNAQQTSQIYSHSWPTITRWNADNSLIVINSGICIRNGHIS